MKSTTDPLMATTLECEFVPPVDLPDTWGTTHQSAVKATAAWQEAYARLRGESAQGAGFAGLAAMGTPTIRTVTRMSVLASSLRERLLQLQSAAADLAIAELAQRDSNMPGTDHQELALRPLHPENARRLAELTRAWFDLMAAAQSEMRLLTGLVALDPGDQRSGTFVERRRSPRVIDFPDRRAA